MMELYDVGVIMFGVLFVCGVGLPVVLFVWCEWATRDIQDRYWPVQASTQKQAD